MLLRIEAFSLWLTPKQTKFVQDVYNIIERDLKENNTDAFRWKEDGTPVFKETSYSETDDEINKSRND